jgi:hypothetical protein
MNCDEDNKVERGAGAQSGHVLMVLEAPSRIVMVNKVVTPEVLAEVVQFVGRMQAEGKL